MNEKPLSECSKNPHKNGHCMHESVTNSTGGGLVMIKRCCWCGERSTTQIRIPDHGTFVP